MPPPSLWDYLRPPPPNPFGPFNSRVTYYAPGPGDRMEGGFETSRPNPGTGQRRPSTLDDVRLGTSPFVTLAGDPSRYGQTVKMGPLTYTSPLDQKSYTLPDVTGYVHDTGSAFKGRPDKLDVAAGDYRGWSPQAASAAVQADAGNRTVTPLEGDEADRALRPVGMPEPWRATGEGESPTETAMASGPPQQRQKTMANSLMDMFQTRDAAGEPSSFADALQSRSNSLIGLGLGLLQPSNPLQGQSSWGNALQGFQAGAGLDARTAQAAAMLKQHRADQAQAQANLQITDAQRAMRDVLGPNASPEQKADFMKNYYASKTDPGAWILKDIIDPRDPEGERKITVQEHNRTGQIRPPQLPDQGGTAAGPPAVNWSGSNAPVYGAGGNYTPGAGAAAASAPPRGTITMPSGEVVTPPPGLNQAGKKTWANHMATIAADVAAGKMTQEQGNSNLFAGKMEIAKNMLDPETEKKGLDPVWNRVERYGGWLGNTMVLPNDYKQYQTAKDAFLNAFLRRVSGATVHDAEYYREEKVYFPQPGDDAKRIEYKRQLRDDAIMRMKQQVGPGYKPPPLPPSKDGTASDTVKWGRDDQGNPVPMP
ncbi:MAG TPA: hypothetical protein VFA91_02965 [Candidatus Polarisedimenticolia bacterium]|nr:hypothetical protein [Candidatus Polarisedimenticolia bacterium]